KISGTFEGELENMEKSKKTTLNDLLRIMNKSFEAIDKKFEAMDKKIDLMNKKIDLLDKRLEVMDKKIDLILATPTIQREIDHKALSELD
ncbi:MAG: hypothetical protein ACRDCJ_03075, partial [Metamycoplasmataceae bacterium]